MKQLGFALVIGCILWLALGCAPSAGEKDSGSANAKVVATTGMVGDVVRAVGGDLVDVTVLMGPGVDPHLYKVSPEEVQRLSNADMIFYNGLRLEGKMADVLERLATRKPVVPLAERLPKERLLAEPGETAFDPHVWFDVMLWRDTVAVVEDALIERFPDQAHAIRSRANEYRSELNFLHDDVRQQIRSIPRERRVLITAHDAFRYFGRAYGMDVRGIQGLSTESEAGLKRIEELVALIAERRIPAVFVESTISERNVTALIEGARRKGAKVRLGGTLYSDAMGPAGTPEATYVGMVRHNAKQISEGLR